MNSEKIFDFLGKVYLNFKRSEIAYSNYMNDYKKYLHAKVLKSCNEMIRTLLLENAYLLSESLREDSLKIISHLDIWLEKWNEHERLRQPKNDDEFVFLNTFTFPKDAAKNLENEFFKLNK